MRISPINNTLIYNNQRPIFKSQETTNSFNWEEVSAGLMAGGFLLSHYSMRDYIKDAKTKFGKVPRIMLCVGVIAYVATIISKDIQKLFD